ncbi:membrane-associated protein, putative [Bodo saltans]|uniref:Membrane-associated protein, putative n=1 Tax=Bodo saltans TaxID=75058 RepID=A0A0S4JAY4_BODSA|nr:membrane-associated protein, putative [Bodo saltans]|eukprot:CUG87168.1 membrane-associated protein, putative [Bodo saltans]
MSSLSSPSQITENNNSIPLWEAILLIGGFIVLYMFVIPKLFPSVVNGGMVIDSAMMAKRKSSNSKKTDGNEIIDEKDSIGSFVVSGGIGFATGHRTQAKAQLRRRETEERKTYMV